MTTTLFNRNLSYFIYGLPLLIVAVSISIGLSPHLIQYPELAVGITYDLTLSAPIIYLLLIRKTDISKITVVPFITGGIAIATYLLPSEQHFHLNLVKYWLLPVAELAVVGYVGFAAYRAIKIFKDVKTESADVLTVLRRTCVEIYDRFFSKTVMVNRGLIARGKKPITFRWYTDLLAFEIAGLYYGFIGWRGFSATTNTFSYHKKSGVLVLYGAVMFIIAAETMVFHILLEQWSAKLAWIVTIPSLYFLIQIFAHAKAMCQRPVEIKEDKLVIRNGLFGETEIELGNIESVELATLPPNEEEFARAALLKDLEQFNTIIRLKDEETFYGLYRLKSKFKTLLLYVDENTEFKKRLDDYESN